mmetsp:Transcript_2703/g.4609  ORF Transcript_2703/g.4609 Transcript_2703/m.4609 type:complete len:158 (+) Transcript_2703:221-694(+)
MTTRMRRITSKVGQEDTKIAITLNKMTETRPTGIILQRVKNEKSTTTEVMHDAIITTLNVRGLRARITAAIGKLLVGNQDTGWIDIILVEGEVTIEVGEDAVEGAGVMTVAVEVGDIPKAEVEEDMPAMVRTEGAMTTMMITVMAMSVVRKEGITGR